MDRNHPQIFIFYIHGRDDFAQHSNDWAVATHAWVGDLTIENRRWVRIVGRSS